LSPTVTRLIWRRLTMFLQNALPYCASITFWWMWKQFFLKRQNWGKGWEPMKYSRMWMHLGKISWTPHQRKNTILRWTRSKKDIHIG
jgi:hypothetical protein